MSYEVFFKIADIIVRAESDQKPEAEKKEPAYRYKNFVLRGKPRRFDIDLSLEIRPDYKNFKPEILFETRPEIIRGRKRLALWRRRTGRLAHRISKEKEKYLGKALNWRIGKVDEQVLLEGGQTVGYQVLLDNDLKRGEVFIINSKNSWKITDIIYGFLQMLIIYYLARHRLGLLVHSAGIKDKGNGYLFAGISQAGKSFTSRIWDKYTKVDVLNDDRIIIRKIGDSFYIYGTPWHGDFSDYLKTSMQRAKLKKMFCIYHKDENEAEVVRARDSFNLFFQTIFSPFWDKDSLAFISEFLLDAIFNVSCYKLGFKNDRAVIDYVRGLK